MNFFRTLTCVAPIPNCLMLQVLMLDGYFYQCFPAPLLYKETATYGTILPITC